MNNYIYILKTIICYMIIFYLYILIKKNLVKDTRYNDVILIKEGRINFKDLILKKCSLFSIIKILKENNIDGLEEVDCAILNREGEISLYTKYEKSNPTTLIIDGTINYRNLKQIRRSKKWITQLLDERRIKLEDISYAFLLNDSFYVIKKGNYL